MFGSSYKVATVFGIPIKIHVSLIVVFAIFALGTGIRSGPIGILLLAVLGSAALSSIALHELGHSLVAIKKGCRVHEITLMIIGGAAQMEEVPTRPRDEIQMALAGPAVSLLLGTGGCLLGRYLIGRGAVYVGDVILRLGWWNFFLAGFNLLPSFPMDGGRVLRAMLTPRRGRLHATFIAARLGQIMAILFGLYGFMSERWPLVAIAFFVFAAAANEYRIEQIRAAARARDFESWRPHERGWPDGDDEDKVIVSPPRYRSGPDAKVDVHASNDDSPFRRIFRV